MKVLLAALASVSFCSSAALAQTAPITPAQQTAVLGTSADNALRAGTPIALKMAEALTTKGKNLRVGYRFQMEVAEPVLVNGVVVIPAGSPATGEVTDVRNKGMWGKSGRIGARALFVRVNGRQIRLTGQLDDKGTTGTAGVVGSIALLPIAGFLVTGTSASIPLGAPVGGFIDEDIPVSFAATAATPMVVAAPAAAAPVVAAPVQTPTAVKPKN